MGQTPLSESLAILRRPPPGPGGRVCSVASIGKRIFIRPENAVALLDALPESADASAHIVFPGDFIFGDFVEQLATKTGAARVEIATLSLSLANISSLVAMAQAGTFIDLIISDFFRATNEEIHRALTNRLAAESTARITVARNHAKIVVFHLPEGLPIIIETSANLRSSSNIETASLFRAPELAAHHSSWMTSLHLKARQTPSQILRPVTPT